MRQDCTPTWIDGDGEYHALRRGRLTDRDFSEDFLQRTLHACPDILPVDEFDPDFGPLVSLGREVNSVDNLFIAPSGKITIVETKLWRNPQATREVVAQILDYATRMSQWSLEDLEGHCRTAKVPVLAAGQSLYQLVQAHYPDDVPPEEEFNDAVQRSLSTGRFLLLIVGDGIREGLPDLLGALHTRPRLLFTFGLVELQVYQDPAAPSKRLIVPQIVANSTEVVRAVVRVVTSGQANVTVELEDSGGGEGGGSRKRKLSEDEFFDEVPDEATSETIRQLLASARELGAIVQPGSSSLSVRLKDPGGSRRRLTLFVVKTTGELFTGWLLRQLERIGSDTEIARDWTASVADLVSGVEPNPDPRYCDWLTRNITMDELEPVLDEFVNRLSETVEAIRDSVS